MKAKDLITIATGFVGALALLAFAGAASQSVTTAQEPGCLQVKGAPTAQQLPYCIEIIKQTDPDGADDEFPFHVSLAFDSGAVYDFNLEDDESQLIGIEPRNQVLISEDIPDGWELTDIDCEGDFMVIEEGDDYIILDVVFGENESPPTIVCVFENEQVEDDEDEGPSTRPNVGGAFAGDGGAAARNRARANAAGAAAAAAVASAPAASVRPPSTGDGGLLP